MNEGGFSMEESILKVRLRNKKGKSYTRKLRRKGEVPAVLYGHHLNKNLLLEVESRELHTFLSRYFQGEKVAKLQIVDDEENKQREVIVKSVQWDPVKRFLQHVDFYEITRGEKITATVPLSFVGKSRGERGGGIVEHFLREIEIECLPMDIPSVIEVDINSLDIGDSFYVKDLKVSPKITIKSPSQEIVVSIASPREEEKLEEKEEAKEVEVITEKKEEEAEEKSEEKKSKKVEKKEK